MRKSDRAISAAKLRDRMAADITADIRERQFAECREIGDALYAELKALRARFHRACILLGSDPEFADAACASADAALAKARGE